MIFFLFLTVGLVNYSYTMEQQVQSQDEVLIHVQLQDVHMCLATTFAEALASAAKKVTMNDGRIFMPLQFAQWKLVEPFFRLIAEASVNRSAHERLNKKMRLLCSTLCGKQLAELRAVAEKIEFAQLLSILEHVEERLNTLAQLAINDNDKLTVLTSDWKKVSVCWRLARLSRILADPILHAADYSRPIPLQSIDTETWRMIRQLLSFQYRLNKKKSGLSASNANEKITTLIVGLDEAKLIRLFTGINYLDIPSLFERAKTLLLRKKITTYDDPALLSLPAVERNMLIRTALIATLGMLDGCLTATYASTLDKIHALDSGAASDGCIRGCFIAKEEMHVIDLESKQGFKYSLHPFSSIMFIRFTPQGDLIAAQGDATFSVWDLKERKAKRLFGEAHFGNAGEAANDACMGLDGRLYTCHLEGCVRVWHEETGKELSKLYGGDFLWRSNILSICLVNDGKEDGKIAAGSVSGVVFIWDMKSGNLLHLCEDDKGPLEPIYALCASADGRVFAGACDGLVRVWDSHTGILLDKWAIRSRIASIKSFSNGMLFCGLADGTVCILDDATGCVLMQCRGHKSWVYSLTVTKNNKLFAGAPSPDGAIYEWDLTFLEILKTMNLQNAQAVLQYLQELKTAASEGKDSQKPSWDIIKGILGYKDSKPVAASEPSCIVQ